MREYYNSLDRGMYDKKIDPNTLYNSVPVVDEPAKPNYNYSIREIGTTDVLVGNNTDPVRLVQSRIRQGVGHLEISAIQTGAGRGGQQKGFEEIDIEERRALREIQKAVGGFDLTTHATPAVHGGAGLDPQNGRYSEENRKRMMDEIKKAIDFAGEATFGGSVVMHTGEFQRSMYNMPGQEGLFETHPFEEEDAAYNLVNTKDLRVIGGIKENTEVWVPIQEKDKDGKPKFLKTLVRDQKTGEEKIIDLIDDITKDKIPVYKKKENGEIDFRKINFKEFVHENWQKDEYKKEIDNYFQKMSGQKMPSKIKEDNVFVKEIMAKEFYKEIMRSQVAARLGQSRQYFDNYVKGLEKREKIIEQLQFYRNLKSKYGDDWKKFEQEMRDPRNPFLPPEVIDPVEYLEDELKSNAREIAYGRELTQSGLKEAYEQIEGVNKAQTQREFSLGRSYQTYAELGIYAMDKTNAMKNSLSNDDKKRVTPIAITMENIFPEEYGYGSGADEIISLIKKSREKMADLLTQKKIEHPLGVTEKDKEGKEKIKVIDNPYYRSDIDKNKAKKIAEDHIKMTFDTGHFNMWRKYFKRQHGESDEKFDARFKKWYLGEVDKLVKADVIGNVHMADNFGYDDNHLTPGYGNAPIKEAMEKIKHEKFKGSIAVEGGWGQGKGVHEVWNKFSSPIFQKQRSESWTNVGQATASVPMYTGFAQGSSWSEIQEGYLGRMHRPYFIFGSYNTGNQDDNKPWSQTSME